LLNLYVLDRKVEKITVDCKGLNNSENTPVAYLDVFNQICVLENKEYQGNSILGKQVTQLKLKKITSI
jgi:hypothetical protein